MATSTISCEQNSFMESVVVLRLSEGRGTVSVFQLFSQRLYSDSTSGLSADLWLSDKLFNFSSSRVFNDLFICF